METSRLSRRTCIASWIVLDDLPSATAFPSVGVSSADPKFQLVYWQCIAIFFLTSRVHNPSRRHMLFSNVNIALVAPAEIVAFLNILGVEFSTLAISYRLPLGSVKSWGNQFYVLDIIKHFAMFGPDEALILADSDCIWRKSIDTFESSIFEHSCLLYTLSKDDQKNYELGKLLNGMSHGRMTELANRLFPNRATSLVKYHGGEFFCATRQYCQEILPYFGDLWHVACDEVDQPDSIKEEAHFLSIIADGLGKAPCTATHVVRRIWTNFEDINVRVTDLDLALWHLPAEKKFGFHRLWRRVQPFGSEVLRINEIEMNRMTARYMGVPRRGMRKAIRDLTSKIISFSYRHVCQKLGTTR